jgi:hypothetical protein
MSNAFPEDRHVAAVNGQRKYLEQPSKLSREKKEGAGGAAIQRSEPPSSEKVYD